MAPYTVKLKGVDTSLGGSGGRVVSVRASSSKSFTTPARPICAEEITAKNFLGYGGEIEAPLGVLPLNVNGGRLQKLRKRNGLVIELGRTLQSLNDSAWLVPSFPIIQTDEPLSCGRDELHKTMYEMQIGTTGLDYVCMPLVNGSLPDFKVAVEDWVGSAEKEGLGCVVQLDMKDDPEKLGQKLDFLASMTETGAVSVVNLIYANPRTYPIQYAALWSRRESLEALVNCSEVPRSIDRGEVKSEIQTRLISYGIDTFSRKKRVLSQKAIGYLNSQPAPETLDDAQGYSMAIHKASTRLGHKSYTRVEHEYRCNCSICRGRFIDELTEKYAYKDNGEIESRGMTYFSHIHDHQSDQAEMEIVGKFIRSNETKEYNALQESEKNRLLKLLNG